MARWNALVMLSFVAVSLLYILTVHVGLRSLEKCPSTPAQKIQVAEKPEARVHSDSYRTGVIVLGMHRSGTSIVAGLMNKMGLEVGPSWLLIQPNFDNEKGFFERVDVVLQNDAIMHEQNVHYSLNTHKYDALRGLRVVLQNMENGKLFSEGRRALAFLNNAANYPWMLKDPRLCITLRTWLPILKSIPAVVLTYRHPLDVAKSLKKREGFQMKRALKLWISYNAGMVKNSHDLCKVITSNRLMLSQPAVELKRIYDGLRACGVNVPRMVAQAEIDDFIDPKLQHNTATQTDEWCARIAAGQELVSTEALGWVPKTADESDALNEAIRIYCALEDGSALRNDFKWRDDLTDF